MPIYPVKDRKTKQQIRNQWRMRASSQGKQLERTFHGTKKEAREALARWELKLAAELPLSLETVPRFSAFCVGRYRIHAETHLARSTWKIRQYHIATLSQFFGDTPLTKISAAMVEEYHLERLEAGLSSVTVNDEVKVLKVILSYARSMDIPAATPKIRKLPEKGRKRVMVWDDAAVSQLYEAMPPDLLGMAVCLLNTGMRPGEALVLERGWINEERGMIEIQPNEFWQPKSGKPREIPIGSALAPWLAGGSHDRWIFPTPSGERYSCFPKRRWREAIEAAGIGGSPHICRHTFASHFLQGRPNLYLLSQVLGHSQAHVTERYSHMLPEHLEQARDVVRLGVPLKLLQK